MYHLYNVTIKPNHYNTDDNTHHKSHDLRKIVFTPILFHTKKEYPVYDTKLYLTMRLQMGQNRSV